MTSRLPRIPFKAVQAVCRRCHSTTSPSAPARSTSSSSGDPGMGQAVRTRFAPSPTGFLHVGGLRTALINYLMARKSDGQFILRIEDTDRARLVPGAVDNLRQTFEWVGLEYDEGVGVGGSYGPYVQSERRDLYNHHIKTLLENDSAYECFCRPEDLEAQRQASLKAGQRVSYDGRCRHVTAEDVSRRKKAGHDYIVRFKDPGGAPILLQDIVFGEVTAHTDAGFDKKDDFVLMKSDGYPTYHFASIVDDHEMRISHVVRGEEWLPSLPKHVSLYSAFGWTPPQFAHLPLMVNENGEKLSKRKHDVAVESYREKGYEPEALLNFLGILGWDYEASLKKILGGELPKHQRNDDNSLYEIFSLPQLIQAFDINHLAKRKSQVNMKKLDFINKMHLRSKAGALGKDAATISIGKDEMRQGWAERRGDDGLYGLLRRYRADLLAIPELRGSPFLSDESYIEKVFHAELPRTVKLNEMARNSLFFYLYPDYYAPKSLEYFETIAQRSYRRNISHLCNMIEEFDTAKREAFTVDDGWALFSYAAKDLQLTNRREIIKQIRHALTGLKEGPSVPQTMAILGVERTLERLRAGMKFVTERWEETLQKKWADGGMTKHSERD